MIEFNKIVGIPDDVDAGEERVWFTDSGLIYVADNMGHPTRFGSGFMQGETIPIGKPPASGILYFCSGNGQYYLSDPTRWIVLNTEPKAGGGSGGGSGYASGVFLTDAGNHFTSTEVEGALQEIGATFTQMLGDQELKPLNSNLLSFTGAGERLVSTNVPNSPTPLSSWLNQRFSGGRTYGLMVADNGDAFTRHGNNFTKLATESDLQEAIEEMGADIGDAVKALDGLKILEDPGIIISGTTGLLKESPRIGLDMNVITKKVTELINASIIKNPVPEPTPTNPTPTPTPTLGFVPTIGGTMTGDLTIDKTTPQLILDNALSGHKYAIGGTSASGSFYIKDMANNLDLIRYDAVSKKLKLSNYENANGIQALGPFQVANTTNPRVPNGPNESLFALYVDGSNGNHAIFRGANGATLIREDQSSNLIQSTNSAYTGSRNFYIGGYKGDTMNEFKVAAAEARFTQNVNISNTLSVGVDQSGPYGLINSNNKIIVYPRNKKSSEDHAMARRFMAQMSYDRAGDTFEFKGYKTNTNNTNWEEAPLNVSAIKFVNRSSEKFKENIEEFQESGLDLVKKIQTYTYNFKIKDKDKKDLGFIIERGVPDIAIEEDGNSIDSYAMVSILWKAVQELNAKVEELENN